MEFNFPEAFIESLQSAPGFNAGDFIRSHSLTVPVSVRINPAKNYDPGNDLKNVPWHPDGKYLPSRPDFTLDPAFHAGAYYVQEASSMSIFAALEEHTDNEGNLRVLDLCGAPGGKSTLIASWMKGNGLLVANEVIRSRAAILEENLIRWGTPNVIVSNSDPRQFARLEGFFDVIVVDAPCSGSGMFRKDNAAMGHWSLNSVEHCAARQRRILTNIWPALRENGLLVYSTCSYSEAEDEEISNWVKSDLEAEILTIRSLETIPGIIKTNAGYRFYPDKIEGEGFYISAIRKTSAQEELTFKSLQKTKAIPEFISQWLKDPGNYCLVETHLGESLIPATVKELLPHLLKHLHIVKCGISAGELKGKTYLPSHDMALSTFLNKDIPAIDLGREEALRFLKKEALPAILGKSGYNLMRYNGLGLGWGNALPNRINNYLPKSWRIIKSITESNTNQGESITN